MDDLFYREQSIFDDAKEHMAAIRDGAPFDTAEYDKLVKEYGRLLKQLRRVTKISDRTTVDLNTSKLDLLDKVHYDVLTGIYNRRFLEETLRRIIKSMSRTGGILSVLMLDVDFFKKYNDTYGHDMGDKCLKAVAETISKDITRADDFVARYGGEEFVVVLQNTDEEGACLVADRILDSIRKCNIPHSANSVASCVTASIGVTTGNATFSQTGVDYLKKADEALYISKNDGRNRYTFIKL